LLVRKGSFAWRTLTSIQGELRCVTTIDGKKTEKTFTPGDQFAPELIYFSDCTIHDRVPEPPGNEGLADVIVIDAIYESAEIASTGKVARPGCRSSAAIGAVFASGHLANWPRTRWLGKQRDRSSFSCAAAQ